MDIRKEIVLIRKLFDLSFQDLADKLGVSIDSVMRWENAKVEPERKHVEQIYNFAYKNGLQINKIYEQILKEEFEKKNIKLLFHGSKGNINFPIDFNHTRKNNDFGIGFYLGENLQQAATYISSLDSSSVYIFTINTKNLKIAKFNVDTEWMIAIAFYRGWLDEFKENSIVKKFLSKGK